MDASAETVGRGTGAIMTIKTCDRCGSKINTNPMANVILPVFSVREMSNLMIGWQTVDLCQKCNGELAGWLKNKGGQE